MNVIMIIQNNIQIIPLLRNVVRRKEKRISLAILILLDCFGLNSQKYSSIVKSASSPPNMTSCASVMDMIIIKGVSMKKRRLP